MIHPPDVKKLLLEAAGPLSRARTGGRPAPRRVAQLPKSGRDQLAAELMVLLLTLQRRLDDYLAARPEGPAEESAQLLNDSAVVWMQESLLDLEATVVGLEAAAATARTDPWEPRQARHGGRGAP